MWLDDEDWKPVSYAMMVVALLLVVVGLLAMSETPACAAPDGRGNNTTEDRSTGAPDNPRGFGSVTSQRALNDHDIGTHVSTQDTPHLGVGNVAANDGALADLAGVPDTGTRPSDHADPIGALTEYNPTTRPGTHEP